MYSQLAGVLIPCARPLSFKQSICVIERNRAPTGTNRPFRSRFGAVLDARVILNAGGLHFPILLSSPTNSPHRTPGTAFLSRIARGSITQAIFCDPQLEMSILECAATIVCPRSAVFTKEVLIVYREGVDGSLAQYFPSTTFSHHLYIF